MRFAVPCVCFCAILHGATGTLDPRLSPFDDAMNALLAKWRIPGAAVGVSHDGRLVLTRGYGMAAGGGPVQPDAIFPIPGVADAFSAAAVQLLTENRRLVLDNGAGGVRDLLRTSPRTLDRIVARASGQSVESYVQASLLDPLGIADIRTAPSGGWTANATALLRFANALDGRRPPPLLQPASFHAILPAGADADWWLTGSTPDSSSYLFRQAVTGVDVALLFNARPSDSDAFDREVMDSMTRAASSVREWPPIDVFFHGPELFARDIVNSADYTGGKVSPGEIVVLYPSNAGPLELAGSQLNDQQRIATITGETRVLFDGIPAPMASSVQGRIGAVVPYGIAGHATTEIVVEYRGVRSPPVSRPVVDSTPAIFTLDASGKGQAAMLNETGCCNSVRNPAARGSVAALYATGEGQTTPAGIDGDLSGHDREAELPKPRLPVSVTVGGIPAEITYAGEAPHAVAGLLQVNFRIPATAPIGDAVPLVLQVGAARSSAGATMAVRSEVRRVLILDSDAATRGQLVKTLKDAGYEVFAASNGQAARSEAGQHPIDLLICSLALAEAERREAVRTVIAERPRVRIVATAATLDSTTLKDADLLGAQAVVTKPLVPATVLRRVRELLRSRPFPYVADEETAPSFPSAAPRAR